MRKNKFGDWLAISLALCLFLAGCGITTVITHSPSSANTSPGTSTSGPVAISTDHSVYLPGDTIAVTVLNKLATPIYAEDTQASCSILGLEQQTGDQWLSTSIARCPLGRVAEAVTIQPGASYTATVHAGELPGQSTPFPTGKYRLILAYTTTPGYAATPTLIYSQTIAVACNGACPTPVPGTSTSGTSVPATAIAGTAIPIGTGASQP